MITNILISHTKLQRLLQKERNWNLFLKQKYGHLIKRTVILKKNKQKAIKTFVIIDGTG
jgi:hypothetical protein